MPRQTKADWMKLCEKVAVEQDPKKLMKLIATITRILSEKQHRLEKSMVARKSPSTSGTR
jgi:hypothetical protein